MMGRPMRSSEAVLRLDKQGDTMPGMAGKKPKRKPPNYRHPRVVFHVPAELLAVIDESAREVSRTRTAELVRRLTEAYVAVGRWPPAPKAS
jgi:hypothetical protein